MQNIVAQTFQEESGRVIALLYSHIRDFELVEDVVQDAFVLALERWERDGVPDNPAGWILVVARRKAIDRLRRAKNLEHKKAILKTLIEMEQLQETEIDVDSIPDERLKLMFTCCHPALAKEAQVALTLQTLGGLKTPDIAHAFLVPVPTMAQRLVRAKRKIRNAGIPYQVPSLDILTERLDVVCSVLYLIFNAGYTAHSGESLIRHDLCGEAIRLNRILLNLLDKEASLSQNAEVLGLLALMLLHDSRSQARVNEAGDLIPLEEQDRTQWKQQHIEEGLRLLDEALAMRRAGPYQIQAAISALHAQARTPDETDWGEIAMLYNLLLRMIPSPVIELNRAVAIAMSEGYEAGLALLDDIESRGDLGRYYLLHAARADLLRRLERWAEAESAYHLALGFCDNQTEKAFLHRRLLEIQTSHDK